jgi:cell division protein FtsN
MDDQNSESGFELVLDNPKLVLIFALFIAICGGFFVLGFIEGKRQGFQEGSLASAEDASQEIYDGGEASQGSKAVPLNEVVTEARRDMVESRDEAAGETEPAEPTMESRSSENAQASASRTGPADKSESAEDPVFSAPTAYSVQVGAFRRQADAEKQARLIRSKGYDCRIEPPGPPQQLYLLKVGRYKTRAEAVAMQLRLKQSGFATFIKTD